MSKVETTAAVRQAPDDPSDPSKRTQILTGAREVFLAKGYEGASMDTIARAAGVSKGTLYVYFDNKDRLFEALILGERETLAEQLFETGGDTADLGAYLTSVGTRYLDVMAAPEHIASIRMVIGAVEKFPPFGRLFYAAGPSRGIEKLAVVFRAAIAEGRMRDCDPEMAAEHFINLCGAGLLKRLLFDVEREPTAERKRTVSTAAVEVFMRAYGV